MKGKGEDVFLIKLLVIFGEVVKVLCDKCIGVLIVMDDVGDFCGIFLECDIVCKLVDMLG